MSQRFTNFERKAPVKNDYQGFAIKARSYNQAIKEAIGSWRALGGGGDGRGGPHLRRSGPRVARQSMLINFRLTIPRFTGERKSAALCGFHQASQRRPLGALLHPDNASVISTQSKGPSGQHAHQTYGSSTQGKTTLITGKWTGCI
ncbi:hypothetical protein EVAR_30524_1 [Eumeta japonica]|uniref:Uncharacterized protein n=1 Tax=Eumeta variegata TaxID=151549 RepID=A0A4C1VYL7_EUMVA|nr:hypothetical protein EVAR_30524_1 [Eumeta japonica]